MMSRYYINHTAMSVTEYSSWKSIASRKLLDLAGIKYVQHEMIAKEITIDFNSILQS